MDWLNGLFGTALIYHVELVSLAIITLQVLMTFDLLPIDIFFCPLILLHYPCLISAFTPI